MLVTFRANTNILGYKAGKFYTTELTDTLEAVLKHDRHLSLVDPPSLDMKSETENPESKKIKKADSLIEKESFKSL